MLDASSPFLPASIAEALLDVASRRLRTAIVSCELTPGDFVHEAALAERFGLGRASVRVALTELAAGRFVSRHARQGWRIAPIDGALIGAVIDGRRRLEPALAAHRLAEPALSTATALLGMVQSVSGRTELAALATARAAERQLRNLLAAGAGVFASDWLGEIWDHSDRIVRMLDLGGHAIPSADLGELVAALGAGDSDLAGMLQPGTILYDSEGAAAATVEAVNGKEVTVLVDKAKATLPVSSLSKGRHGVEIATTAADFRAKIAAQVPPAAAPSPQASEAPRP